MRERLDRSTADLLVAVNGKKVRTVAEFRETIQSFKPGDTVKLTVIRDNRRLDISVELGGGPPRDR